MSPFCHQTLLVIHTSIRDYVLKHYHSELWRHCLISSQDPVWVVVCFPNPPPPHLLPSVSLLPFRVSHSSSLLFTFSVSSQDVWCLSSGIQPVYGHFSTMVHDCNSENQLVTAALQNTFSLFLLSLKVLGPKNIWIGNDNVLLFLFYWSLAFLFSITFN